MLPSAPLLCEFLEPLAALLGMLDLAQHLVEDGVVVDGTGNSSTAC
jgi:hypothetical protein